MKIYPALIEDLPFIRNFAMSLVVSSNSKSDTGFIDYIVPSLEEYEQMWLGNKHFYIAEIDKKFGGFLLAFTDSHFTKLNIDSGNLRDYLMKLPRPFIYAYTLGVAPEFQGKGLAKKLFSRLFSDAVNYKTIYCAVVHAPLLNKRSKNLVLNCGFKLIDELEIEGLIFGIYKKEL